MLSQQAMSDRLEIETVLVRYVNAIDTRDFDALDAVFTPDARIDYTAMGGMAGSYAEVRPWLADVLPRFPAYYHLLGNIAATIDGDSAHSRTACFNPMTVELAGGVRQTMFLGLWYIDDWLRTPEGWRITRRIEEKCFDHNVPAPMNTGTQAS